MNQIKFIPSNVYGFIINYNHLTTKNAVYTPTNEPSIAFFQKVRKIPISTILAPKIQYSSSEHNQFPFRPWLKKFCIEYSCCSYQDFCIAFFKFKGDLDIDKILTEHNLEDPKDPMHP